MKIRNIVLDSIGKKNFTDYSIDGEIDFASILDRNPDGIKQYTSRFVGIMFIIR